MMSAHDVAVAALNEVASSQISESQPTRDMNGATTAASIEAPASTPTSKNVSGADPRDANAFGGFLSSSSENSQSTFADATTSPTSDVFSSESQESQSQLSQLSQAAATQLPLSQSADIALPALSVATNAGQKRTHDGYVKSPDSNSSESPPVASYRGHSRHASNISTTSSIASSRELASELKTRLSYALVKVTKGWEAFPIEEVESLTSQAGSPASSSSTLHCRRNIITSPRTAIATIQGHAREVTKHDSTACTSRTQPESVSCTDYQPSRTYESFWREQNQRHTGISTNFTSPTSTSASLAPALDFASTTRHPSHPRRPETPRFTRPPILTGRSTSDLSQSSQQSGGAAPPRTPNRTGHTVDLMLHTPNQKSIQERDAIETLLFMSSPGNSSTMGHSFPPHNQTSQQPSPLRAEFGAPLCGAQGRNLEFADAKISGDSEAPPLMPSARRARLDISHKLGDDDFEKMLDNMPDNESSDEDEIEIITPRRLAAGRV